MIETLPGAEPFPPPLATRLGAALAALGPGYEPRTHHRDGRAPRFTNRLALEASPYLLQHAHNPVNWYPWGDEAFDEARRTRPARSSSRSGYSTCHWCHVMEEESFEDLEIARFLNEHFVPIKVDREERPDVDAVYMTAVQALTGQRRLAHERLARRPTGEPFFGGTYFPARDGDRGAPRGLPHRARATSPASTGATRRRVARAAASLTEAVRAAIGAASAAARTPGAEVHRAPRWPSYAPHPRPAARRRARRPQVPLQPAGAPPPPPPPAHRRRALARDGRRTRWSGWPPAASTTRWAAASTATRPTSVWLVPHFEKMLYDNALLAVAYAEAWQVTGRAGLRPGGARARSTTCCAR